MRMSMLISHALVDSVQGLILFYHVVLPCAYVYVASEDQAWVNFEIRDSLSTVYPVQFYSRSIRIHFKFFNSHSDLDLHVREMHG